MSVSRDQIDHGNAPLWWCALFLSTSAFHNAGFCPLFSGLPMPKGVIAPYFGMVMMILILGGNTCYPLALRLLVWLQHRFPCRSRSAAMSEAHLLLLKDPRRFYTHLFRSNATHWLALVTVILALALMAALSITDHWSDKQHRIGENLTLGQAAFGIVFQAISTRTAGFSVFNLEHLSNSSALVMCFGMWLSVAPVVVVLRKTRISGTHHPEYDLSGAHRPETSDGTTLRGQVSNFMSENSVPLILLLFLIMLFEDADHVGDKPDILNIVFEFCSAYGTVGLSMTPAPQAVSATWNIWSQIMLMIVMFLGRLRGLPDSIDPCLASVESRMRLNTMGTPTSIVDASFAESGQRAGTSEGSVGASILHLPTRSAEAAGKGILELQSG